MWKNRTKQISLAAIAAIVVIGLARDLGNESVTIMGIAGNNDVEYFRISLDGSQTGFIYAQGGMQNDGSRVMKYPGGGSINE